MLREAPTARVRLHADDEGLERQRHRHVRDARADAAHRVAGEAAALQHPAEQRALEVLVRVKVQKIL